ncbi:MAG: GxxExxY protein [Bacteroidetes bacterium]|nr:GxxExxY protein [Bacteroidota bacterium]
MGQGFVEEVYQQSLEIEFNKRKIPNFPKAPIVIEYKGVILEKKYIADFFCFDDIIVELKAVSTILPEHEAQIINYLKATKVQ